MHTIRYLISTELEECFTRETSTANGLVFSISKKFQELCDIVVTNTTCEIFLQLTRNFWRSTPPELQPLTPKRLDDIMDFASKSDEHSKSA